MAHTTVPVKDYLKQSLEDISNDDWTVDEDQEVFNRFYVGRKDLPGHHMAVNLEYGAKSNPAGPTFVKPTESGEGKRGFKPFGAVLTETYDPHGQVARTNMLSSAQLVSLSTWAAFEIGKEETDKGKPVDLTSIFNSITTKGNEKYGIPQLPFIESLGPETEHIQSQIYLRVKKADGTFMFPHEKEQALAVYGGMTAHGKGSLYRQLPNEVPGSIEEQRRVGATWPALANYSMAINEPGLLRQLPTDLVVDTIHGRKEEVGRGGNVGKWIKGGPTLVHGTPAYVEPFHRNKATGVLEEIEPISFANGETNRGKKYGFSGVSSGNPNPRAGEIQTMLVDPTALGAAVPGGGFDYLNEQDLQADAWGKRINITFPIPISDANHFLETGQQLNIAKNLPGRIIRSGSRGMSVGTLKNADNIDVLHARSRPSDVDITGASLSIPLYFRTATGQFTDAPGEGIESTEKFVTPWSEKLGIPVHRNPSSLTTTFLNVAGIQETAKNKQKSRDVKALGNPTYMYESVKIEGVKNKVPFSMFTSEIKGDEFNTGAFMGALTRTQTQKLYKQWANARPDDKAARQTATWFEKQTGDTWDIGETARKYNEFAGLNPNDQGYLSRNSFANQIVKDVFVASKDNPRRNAANWKNFEMAYAKAGQTVTIGIASPDYVASWMDAERHGWMEANPQGTEEQFKEQWLAKHPEGQDVGAKYSTRQVTLTKDALVARVFVQNSIVYSFRSNVNQRLRETLAENFPKFSKEIGIDYSEDRASPSGKLFENIRGGMALSQGVWTGTLNEVPSSARTISKDEAGQIHAIASKTDIPESQRIQEMKDLLGDEGKFEYLHFAGSDSYITHPDRIDAAIYKQGETEFPGLGRYWMRTTNRLSNFEAQHEGAPRADYGLRLTAGWYKKSREFATAASGGVKAANEVRPSAGAGTAISLGPWNQSNQVTFGPKTGMGMLRESAFWGGGDYVSEKELKDFYDIGGSMDRKLGIMTYHPQMAGQSSVHGFEALWGEGLKEVMGENIYNRYLADTRHQYMISTSLDMLSAMDRDLDGDPISIALGVKFEKDSEGVLRLRKLNTEELEKVQMTRERAIAVNKATMPTIWQDVNALIGAGDDAAKSTDILEKISDRQLVHVDQVQGRSQSMAQQKNSGMGVAYNFGEKLVAATRAFNMSPETREAATNVATSLYKGPMDFYMKAGVNSAGPNIAKVVSSMRFARNEDTGEMRILGWKNPTKPNEVGSAISGTLDDNLEMAQNLAAIAMGEDEMSLDKSGKKRLLGPQQVASLIALDKDRENVASMLEGIDSPEDRVKYARTYINSLSNQERNMMPIVQMAYMTALLKGLEGTDLLTGKENGTPGQTGAVNEFFKYSDTNYSNRLLVAAGEYNRMRKFKYGTMSFSPNITKFSTQYLPEGPSLEMARRFSKLIGITPATEDERAQAENYNETILRAKHLPADPKELRSQQSKEVERIISQGAPIPQTVSPSSLDSDPNDPEGKAKLVLNQVNKNIKKHLRVQGREAEIGDAIHKSFERVGKAENNPDWHFEEPFEREIGGVLMSGKFDFRQGDDTNTSLIVDVKSSSKAQAGQPGYHTMQKGAYSMAFGGAPVRELNYTEEERNAADAILRSTRTSEEKADELDRTIGRRLVDDLKAGNLAPAEPLDEQAVIGRIQAVDKLQRTPSFSHFVGNVAEQINKGAIKLEKSWFGQIGQMKQLMEDGVPDTVPAKKGKDKAADPMANNRQKNVAELSRMMGGTPETTQQNIEGQQVGDTAKIPAMENAAGGPPNQPPSITPGGGGGTPGDGSPVPVWIFGQNSPLKVEGNLKIEGKKPSAAEVKLGLQTAVSQTPTALQESKRLGGMMVDLLDQYVPEGIRTSDMPLENQIGLMLSTNRENVVHSLGKRNLGALSRLEKYNTTTQQAIARGRSAGDSLVADGVPEYAEMQKGIAASSSLALFSQALDITDRTGKGSIPVTEASITEIQNFLDKKVAFTDEIKATQDPVRKKQLQEELRKNDQQLRQKTAAQQEQVATRNIQNIYGQLESINEQGGSMPVELPKQLTKELDDLQKAIKAQQPEEVEPVITASAKAVTQKTIASKQAELLKKETSLRQAIDSGQPKEKIDQLNRERGTIQRDLRALRADDPLTAVRNQMTINDADIAKFTDAGQEVPVDLLNTRKSLSAKESSLTNMVFGRPEKEPKVPKEVATVSRTQVTDLTPLLATKNKTESALANANPAQKDARQKADEAAGKALEIAAKQNALVGVNSELALIQKNIGLAKATPVAADERKQAALVAARLGLVGDLAKLQDTTPKEVEIKNPIPRGYQDPSTLIAQRSMLELTAQAVHGPGRQLAQDLLDNNQQQLDVMNAQNDLLGTNANIGRLSTEISEAQRTGKAVSAETFGKMTAEEATRKRLLKTIAEPESERAKQEAIAAGSYDSLISHLGGDPESKRIRTQEMIAIEMGNKQKEIAGIDQRIVQANLSGRQEPGLIEERRKAEKEFDSLAEQHQKASSPQGGGTLRMPTAELEKLNKVFSDQAELVENLTSANEKQTKSIEKQIKAKENEANATIARASLSVTNDSLRSINNKIKTLTASGQEIPNELIAERKALISQQSSLTDEVEKIDKEDEENKAGLGKRIAGFARKTLGGFGMMYLGRIGSLLTQGMGEGQQERLAYETAQNREQNALFGTSGYVRNQMQDMANVTALNGAAINPMIAGKKFLTENSGARVSSNALIAGIGGYSASMWLAENAGMKAMGGAAAPIIGAAMAIASTAGAVYAGSQDPTGTAYQWSKNIAGQYNPQKTPISDITGWINSIQPGMSYSVMSPTDQAYTSKQAKINAAVTVGMDPVLWAQKTGVVGSREVDKQLTRYPGSGNAQFASSPQQTVEAKKIAQLAQYGSTTTLSNISLEQGVPLSSLFSAVQADIMKKSQGALNSETSAAAATYKLQRPNEVWTPEREQALIANQSGSNGMTWQQQAGTTLQALGWVGSQGYKANIALQNYYEKNPLLMSYESQQILSAGANVMSQLGAMQFVPGTGSAVTDGGKLEVDKLTQTQKEFAEFSTKPFARQALEARSQLYLEKVARGEIDKEKEPFYTPGTPAKPEVRTMTQAEQDLLNNSINSAKSSSASSTGGSILVSPEAPRTLGKIWGGGITADSTPESLRLGRFQDMAETARYQSKQQMGQNYQNQAYSWGRDTLGDQMFQFMDASPNNQTWARNRMMQNDPFMYGAMSNGGRDLSNGPGLRTVNGNVLSGAMAAFTDFNTNMQMTGMNWGTTSLNLGGASGLSATDMAKNIWGADWKNNKAALSMTGITKLAAPITIPGVGGAAATTISEMSGFTKYQWDQQDIQYGFQQRGLGLQQASHALDLAFTTGQGLSAYGSGLFKGGQWGLEDAQRNLGYKQADWQYDLSKRQMESENRMWNESYSMNKKGAIQQRGWAQQDWGYQTQVREMQWGWKQEDFQEESRFMTGRQRRLAERQMKRDTTMYNMEGDQIDRTRDRQKETWKLEDQRFTLEKEQHQISLKFQQESLEKNREFYNEDKKFREAQVKLQRAMWTEQHKIANSQLALQMEQLAVTRENELAMRPWLLANEALRGQMSMLTDDAYAGLIAQTVAASTAITENGTLLDVWIKKIYAANVALGGEGAPEATPTNRSGEHKEIPQAIGGSFIVPDRYGREGFDLGGIRTASAGERITVTSRGGNNQDLDEKTNAYVSSLREQGEVNLQTTFIAMAKSKSSDSMRTINIDIGQTRFASLVVDILTGEIQRG